MNFSKFRKGGDLSDITVVVDGTEFNLHRFPLFARSNHFCQVLRGSGTVAEAGSMRVELAGFPGGAEVFSMVADFCYNLDLDLSKNNVVLVRCAAEFLQMVGPGNLCEVSDKFLQDTITSAKMSRSSMAVTSLLLYCVTAGAIADAAGVVDRCVEALVECWHRPPSKFTSPPSPRTPLNRLPPSDTGSHWSKALGALPPEWFVKVLNEGRKQNVKMTELACLAVRYVTDVLDREDSGKMAANRDSGKSDRDADDKDDDTTIRKSATGGDNNAPQEEKADIGAILDIVLTSLPDEAYIGAGVSTEWLTRVLRIACARGLACRTLLVRVAGELLTVLPPADLCLLAPSVLRDLVAEGSGPGHAERACKLIDTYVTEMASRGVLTSETFRVLASAAPSDGRTSHDALYVALEYVLKSEKDKLSAEQKAELLALVNLSMCGENSLKAALESGVVPSHLVAQAALDLATRLRTELDSVKYIAQMQEEELQKLQARGPRSIMSPATGAPPVVSRNSDSDSREASLKASPDPPVSSTDAMKAAHEVLSAARSKLAASAQSSSDNIRSTYSQRASRGSHFLSSGESDQSPDDELDYHLERAFRSLDPRARQRASLEEGRSRNYGSTFNKYSYPYSFRY